MLTFDSEKHEYKWTSSIVPSVTQVLKSAGIIDHKFSAAGAAEKGTDAHQAIEFWNQGDLDEDSLAEDLRGYVEAWKKFVRDYKLRQVQTEQRVYQPLHRYAGTIDCLCNISEYRNIERKYLIDIKTGSFLRWHSLQLAAYRKCIEEPVECLAVYLKSDGTYQAPKVDMTNAWATFQSALNIYNWKQ